MRFWRQCGKAAHSNPFWCLHFMVSELWILLVQISVRHMIPSIIFTVVLAAVSFLQPFQICRPKSLILPGFTYLEKQKGRNKLIIWGGGDSESSPIWILMEIAISPTSRPFSGFFSLLIEVFKSPHPSKITLPLYFSVKLSGFLSFPCKFHFLHTDNSWTVCNLASVVLNVVPSTLSRHKMVTLKGFLMTDSETCQITSSFYLCSIWCLCWFPSLWNYLPMTQKFLALLLYFSFPIPKAKITGLEWRVVPIYSRCPGAHL